jgi:hypothetical protein
MVRSTRIDTQPPARLALVSWAARVGGVTADALADRDGCSVASAGGRLRAAERAGLLSASRPLTAAPAVFVATRAGLRAAGLQSLDAVSITASNAGHTIACAAVAARLERNYPEQRMMGEHELRSEEREHGGPLASATLAGGSQTAKLHRPDLVLWPQQPAVALPVAVEVELTVKAPRRLSEICRAWARCRCVAGVLYVVSVEVERPLARAIENTQAHGRIATVALQDLLADADAPPIPAARTVPSNA